MSIRHLWLLVHRYVGLAMASFLVLVGLTGSLLAFSIEINHLVSPRFYAKPQPGAARLGFATFIDRAEALVPQEQVYWIQIPSDPNQIDVRFSLRRNTATGKPYPLAVEDLYLNPWTGQELGRRKPGEPYPTAFMDKVRKLHEELFLGNFGFRFMGVIALIWTIDCFIGFYLTLPAALQRFWPRWQQAWLVKWRASAARVNFDLHRASGLWLWPMLFVFAWSSVMFNLPEVYNGVSRAVFHYQWPPADAEMPMQGTGNERPPRLDLQAALSTAQRLMAEQAAIHHFSVMEPEVFAYQFDSRTYFYNVHSSRDIWHSQDSWTTIDFDGDTGALRKLFIPTGEHAGRTVALWLVYLHECWFGLPYRIFVCVLGLVIAMLSYTGVYIWWKKRRGRVLAAQKQKASFSTSVVQPNEASR
ncbi:MAG TPA: PepSY-associated TM helix domain-containing protein [Candidatus Acidoferrales bacterium]|nr:PepSY-associated TM helix domain-containing protein [Candidatus Acidoferrales bacterium]